MSLSQCCGIFSIYRRVPLPSRNVTRVSGASREQLLPLFSASANSEDAFQTFQDGSSLWARYSKKLRPFA
jgi:hypothetical protein